jgi:hypothetical protein
MFFPDGLATVGRWARVIRRTIDLPSRIEDIMTTGAARQVDELEGVHREYSAQ